MNSATSELVWGLLPRGIALVYLVSFASLTSQVLVHCGSMGYSPLSERLARLRRDFPTWRRFVYFPTLSWIHNSDGALASLPWLGLVAAGAALIGGPHTPWAFVACYLIYVTLDRVVYLIFPWDSMLFEAGFFAMFLPPLHVLPNISAVAAPDPALAWVYRLLLFRVLFGFGKFKFLGSTSEDAGYLKGFLINQPLPSPVGWLMQKLPMPLLKLALYLMFLVEIPIPFAVFTPRYSAVAALAIDAFMLVIWSCGTFGYFSLIMIVVSTSWFDPQTAQAFSFANFFSFRGPALLHALIFFHVLGSILSFPFNSYISMTWMNWPVWTRIRPRVLAAPISFYRALHPFRWLHAYGVFPPKPAPPVKIAPVMEVTWDGKEWHGLGHHFSPTSEHSRPKFCSPHHARLDQAFIYDVFGLSDATIIRNLSGWWDPYGHTHVGAAWFVMRRALDGWLPDLLIDPKTVPQRASPPTAARIRTYLLEPTTLRELRSTGRWWKKTLIGPHSGPVSQELGFSDHSLPPPELWHFDDVVWLRRSAMGTLMDRARRGESPHDLILIDGDGLEAEDVKRFWEEFLPSVTPRQGDDWSHLAPIVKGLRARFGREQLYRFERIAGRYGVFLFAKMEPMFLDHGLSPAFGGAPATLDVKTHYHLGLLARHILAEGRGAYDAVSSRPAMANEYLPQLTMQSGGYLLALFRYEGYVTQAQKYRLLQFFLDYEGRRPPTAAEKAAADRREQVLRRIIGPLDMLEYLRTQFAHPELALDAVEAWPQFTFLPDGSITRVPPSVGAPFPSSRSPS